MRMLNGAKRIVFFLIALLCFVESFASSLPLVEELPLSKQIAQLFIIPVGEEFSPEQLSQVKKLIQEEGIGGILLKQGTKEGQKKLIEELQALSSIPLVCLQDAEWGIAMQIRDAEPFPKNEVLGTWQDFSLLYKMGQEIGLQCKTVLADLNLAPVVDLSTEPRNPLIAPRSFGSDPDKVALLAAQVYLGMRSTGIGSCAKHFPGHGAVIADSHQKLPLLLFSKQELKQRELIPFQHLIELGIDAVMTAHMSAPFLTGDPTLPVTFSKQVVDDWLRHEMGFKGLIITDALNMKALTLHYEPGEIALRALIAGHDLLLYGDHISLPINEILFHQVPEGLQAIQEAVLQGTVSQEEISIHVQRLFAFKRMQSGSR